MKWFGSKTGRIPVGPTIPEDLITKKLSAVVEMKEDVWYWVGLEFVHFHNETKEIFVCHTSHPRRIDSHDPLTRQGYGRLAKSNDKFILDLPYNAEISSFFGKILDYDYEGKRHVLVIYDDNYWYPITELRWKGVTYLADDIPK